MGFLSAQHIKKSYGSVTAVDHVSFDVEEGELLTLLGPSGSGKTTVLLAVAGFVDPDEGEILLRGKPISALPPYKRNIGMVFQQYALFPHMTVCENVAYPLTVRRVPRAERQRAVLEALSLVRLAGMEARYPRELSGGQQQRVALARALVFKPPILLMDEPLGALDRKLRADMQMEIRAIQQKVGITTLYVTHDQEEALTISDRIGVMHEGLLLQMGRPMEVYDRPVNTFVADFLGEANIFRGQVIDVRGGLLVLETDSGLQVSAPCHDHWYSRGNTASIAVRPERVRLATGRAGWVHVAATLDQVVYLGNQYRFVLRVGGTRVTAVMGREEVGSMPEVKSTVAIEWSPTAAVLLGSGAGEGGTRDTD